MFNLFNSQQPAPKSADEAVRRANAILQQAGFAPEAVTLKTPASGADGFSGARIRMDLPEEALGALVHATVVEAASEQGISVTQTSLQLNQAGPNGVGIGLRVTAKVFVSSVEVGIRGRVTVSNCGTVEFDSLLMDAGAGMFAGMANAAIKPKLDQLQSEKFELEKIFGRKVTVLQFEFKSSQIQAELEFA
jgi:hypothetical protein